MILTNGELASAIGTAHNLAYGSVGELRALWLEHLFALQEAQAARAQSQEDE